MWSEPAASPGGAESSPASIRHSSLVTRHSRVVVVGSVNSDLVVRVRALPRPGETIQGRDFQTVGGGKGANTAVAAARLGAPVALVARLGEDDFGAARQAELAAEGLDLDQLRRLPGVPSGVALIAVDEAGENTIIVAAGANALLGPDAVTALDLAPGDLLLTQLETPLATVEAALRRARELGARTVLNAAPYHPEVGTLLPLVDVLIVNELEAADLLGRERVTLADAPEAATALLARGAGAVALTLGVEGAVVGRTGQGDERRHIAAPAVPVVDTTAAGDAFVGALAAGLASGEDLFAAAEVAVVAGSLAVTRAGAQPSLPSRAELDDALRRLARGEPLSG